MFSRHRQPLKHLYQPTPSHTSQILHVHLPNPNLTHSSSSSSSTSDRSSCSKAVLTNAVLLSIIPHCFRLVIPPVVWTRPTTARIVVKSVIMGAVSLWYKVSSWLASLPSVLHGVIYANRRSLPLKSPKVAGSSGSWHCITFSTLPYSTLGRLNTMSSNCAVEHYSVPIMKEKGPSRTLTNDMFRSTLFLLDAIVLLILSPPCAIRNLPHRGIFSGSRALIAFRLAGTISRR